MAYNKIRFLTGDLPLLPKFPNRINHNGNLQKQQYFMLFHEHQLHHILATRTIHRLQKGHSFKLWYIMAKDTQDSTFLPIQETIVHNNKTARAIELVILALLTSLLVYRVFSFKNQDHYLPWLVAFLCELWFTFYWILSVSTKWNQNTTITYPERLLKRVNETEFPSVDIFVTTADPILEPSIITMNTVLSLLAVDYPAGKLALYLSDDGCSPLTYYSLVETTKFAKLWIPFCKKYNVQVRAPFRYFTPESIPSGDDSLDFQQEWKKMKNEYGDLYKKIDLAAQRPFTCEPNSDFGIIFCDVNRSDHPAIIKVISENKEDTPSDLPHVIYISREKSLKHPHYFKAGAMNVLARVSGVMTNAPLMLNVDCDMYANNPLVFLHAMCIYFGIKNEEDGGFIQFPQAFYDALKDDPFGNQLVNLAVSIFTQSFCLLQQSFICAKFLLIRFLKDVYKMFASYIANGLSSMQGTLYAGSNCFHQRKIIYGSSPGDISTAKMVNEDLRNTFGESIELREAAAHILSGSDAKIEKRNNPSSFIEKAIHVAGCTYEYGTSWGKKVGWLYGAATEDVLTGINIHGRGWKSVLTSPVPLAFLGCAPTTYPSSLKQQKRWANGLFEILFTSNNPLLLTIKGKLWFRQALGYLWVCMWALRSIPESCYAVLPAYCIITNSNFLPKINEPAFLIPMGIFVIYNLYVFWEFKSLGVSARMWWNLQTMGRVNTITAWLFSFISVMLKLIGLSQTVFELTQKEQSPNNGDDEGRFTYDKSPMIIPGVFILLINLTALVNAMLRLLKVDFSENWIGELGVGEIICSVWVTLCFGEFLKGLFRNGKYGIPFSTIWKSGALALFFVQICRIKSQS
ncbi:cellulose synthase-like B4 [Artemisia annua]|uniref:Cellulose synthase-like B4 n=1 Tax=Artemisia annua TaxID=35608 RepID=A0A2U1PG68_ARTAN|nr:cellulose synthase-like B4 [Artemisia annua]